VRGAALLVEELYALARIEAFGLGHFLRKRLLGKAPRSPAEVARPSRHRLAPISGLSATSSAHSSLTRITTCSPCPTRAAWRSPFRNPPSDHTQSSRTSRSEQRVLSDVQLLRRLTEPGPPRPKFVDRRVDQHGRVSILKLRYRWSLSRGQAVTIESKTDCSTSPTTAPCRHPRAPSSARDDNKMDRRRQASCPGRPTKGDELLSQGRSRRFGELRQDVLPGRQPLPRSHHRGAPYGRYRSDHAGRDAAADPPCSPRQIKEFGALSKPNV
jgi:hypothetical protein